MWPEHSTGESPALHVNKWSGFFHILHILWIKAYIGVGLQRYTGVQVHRDIFCHDTNIDRDIYDT